MQKLTFLGCGNSVKSYFGTNAAVLKTGRNLLMFDCGPLISLNLTKSGLDNGLDNIDLFISHTHGDHIGGVGALIKKYEIQGIKVRIIPTQYAQHNGQIMGTLRKQEIENKNLVLADLDEVAQRHNLKDIKFKLLKHAGRVKTTAMIMTDANDKATIYAPDHNDPDAIKDFLKYKNFEHLYTDATDVVQPLQQTHINIKMLSKIIPTWLYNKVTLMHLNSSTGEIGLRLGFNIANELMYNVCQKTVECSKKLSRLTIQTPKSNRISRNTKDYKHQKKLLKVSEDEAETRDEYGNWF